MPSVDEIIARMIQATGAKNQQEMLEITGLATGLASNWKSRGRVPEKSIAKVADVADVNFQWLKTGEGEMRPTKGLIERDHLDPDLARMVMAEIQGRQGKEPLQLTAGEAAILEMIRDLPEDDRKRVEYEIMTAWVACRQQDK